MFRGVTPVGHSNLKTYRTDCRERCVSVCGIHVFAEDRNILRSFLIG